MATGHGGWRSAMIGTMGSAAGADAVAGGAAGPGAGGVVSRPRLFGRLGAARRIGRPFLEFTGLAYLAAVEIYRSAARAAERSRQAIELAERHGWTDEPAPRTAYITLASVLVGQERLG